MFLMLIFNILHRKSLQTFAVTFAINKQKIIFVFIYVENLKCTTSEIKYYINK